MWKGQDETIRRNEMTPNTIKRTLALLVLLFGIVDSFSEWCNADNDRHLEQAIEAALVDIPPERSSEVQAGSSRPFPILFDGYKVTGLNLLRRQGPLRTYCGNGSQVVNFDLAASEDPILCSFYWRVGGNGSLDLAAYGVRVKTQLKFVQGIPTEDSAAPRKILDEQEEPLTTSLRVARVTFHIGNSTVDRTKATAGFLRHLALASIQDTWEDVFVPKLVHALKEQ
uniref:Metastriate one of each protein family n=1 Tax=Rhipicephalus zambeziensis TaxID=60191 RepID=A0A224YIU4_9ACAR